MVNPIEKYQCANCDEIYEEIGDADGCCMNTLYVYFCSKCNKQYGEEIEAERCCKNE